MVRFDYLEQAVVRAGARKVLFGSDGPWLHPGVELAKVRELRLPPRDEQLVLGGNLLRLVARRLGNRAPMRPIPSFAGGRVGTDVLPLGRAANLERAAGDAEPARGIL